MTLLAFCIQTCCVKPSFTFLWPLYFILCIICEAETPWGHGMQSSHVPWASYQIRKIAGCTCAGNVSPHRRLQRKPLVSDPGMHHGTCVTHVPWCVSGSLARGGGINVPGIPGAYPQFYVSGKRPIEWSTAMNSFLVQRWLLLHVMEKDLLYQWAQILKCRKLTLPYIHAALAIMNGHGVCLLSFTECIMEIFVGYKWTTICVFLFFHNADSECILQLTKVSIILSVPY